MGDLTENFSRDEFACGCGCGYDSVDYALAMTLQALRNFFEQPVTVTSGARCIFHNRAVSGGDQSQHLFGRAADVQVQDVDPALVAEWARDNGVPGVGEYDDFTHIDTRTGARARWRHQ